MISGRKLLIADDSATIRKVVDLTFSDEGMAVTTVGDGDQAIARLEEVEPDIVLADVFMPGRTGYEVCQAIKHSARFHNIPVMLLVGSFEPFDEAEARRVGADDVLTKPFQSIRQLVNRVGTLLGRRPAGGEAPTRPLSTLGLETSNEVGLENSADASSNEGGFQEVSRKEDDDENRDGMMSTAEIELTTADTLPLDEGHTKEVESGALAYVSAETGESPPAEPASDIADADSARSTASDQDRASWAERLASESEPYGQHQETEQPLRAEQMDNTSAQPRATGADEFDDVLLDLGDFDSPPGQTAFTDSILELEDEAPAASRTSEAQEPEAESFSPNARAASAFGDGSHETKFEPGPSDLSAPEPSRKYAAMHQESALGETSGSSWQIVPSQVTVDEVLDAPALSADSSAAQSSVSTSMEEPAEVPTQPGKAVSGSVAGHRLSSEDIDAIARRVVEQMSDKVLREIAWEVVPELAELLIKRRLEEKH